MYLFTSGKLFPIIRNICHDCLFIWFIIDHIVGIKQTGNIQMLFSNIKCQLQVLNLVVLVNGGHVDQIGTMLVNQCTKGNTIFPRIRKVFHILVFLGILFAPCQKCVLHVNNKKMSHLPWHSIPHPKCLEFHTCVSRPKSYQALATDHQNEPALRHTEF